MSDEKQSNVTMRVRIGESEIEVTGPSDFVEKKIAEFQQKEKERTVFPSSASPKSAQVPTAEQQKTLPKGTSIAQFFRKISPKTDVDRVLVAAYYLEKFRNQDNFTATEIKDTIRGAKIPPPGNPSESVNKNIKKGFIMPSGDKDGKMAFVLTSDGEDTIDELLKT